MHIRPRLIVVALAVFGGAHFALVQDASDLAKKLSNPVASLIRVPFQLK